MNAFPTSCDLEITPDGKLEATAVDSWVLVPPDGKLADFKAASEGLIFDVAEVAECDPVSSGLTLALEFLLAPDWSPVLATRPD